MIDLARRLGIEKHFWTTVEGSLDYKLAPLGQSWREFRKLQYRGGTMEYFKHQRRGFNTRNGKFNLYCEGLSRLGYPPLPIYRDVIPRQTNQKTYLLTSAHSRFYFNSEFRNIGVLRACEPDPVLEIHPASAEAEGIANNDWILICANGRQAAFRAGIVDTIAPDVIYAAANWWYPERPSDDGWRRSNVNCLTVNGDENEELGSSNLRGILCSLKKVSEKPDSPVPEWSTRGPDHNEHL